MRYLIPVVLLLVAVPSRAASSLEEASEEAKAMSKLIRENPCYHNIELSVRDLSLSNRSRGSRSALEAPATRLNFSRCENGGTPAEPTARRLYLSEAGDWGLLLINARGSDEISVVETRRDAAGTWREKVYGSVRISSLLRAEVVIPWERERGPASPLPMEAVLDTIPYEHPN